MKRNGISFISIAIFALLLRSPSAAAEDVSLSFSAAFDPDPVTDMIQQLVEGVCDDASDCVSTLRDPTDRQASNWRQLAGYYVVTAFAQLGAHRIPDLVVDRDDQAAWAAGLRRRILTARDALGKDLEINRLGNIDRAVTYPLARADAIFAVADVVAGGTKPSLQRIKSFIGNPLALRQQARHLIRDALRDVVYAQSYRASFRELLVACKSDEKAYASYLDQCIAPAWVAMGRRLVDSCTHLSAIAGQKADECASLEQFPVVVARVDPAIVAAGASK